MEIREKAEKIVNEAEKKLINRFKEIESVALYNQEKVLNAFRNYRVGTRHFAGSTGYGYDDIGRDTLNKVYAEVFQAESAIVSPNIVSGTHALTIALFGLLKTNDLAVSITGKPYDTLNEVIYGIGNGSLLDYKIKFDIIEMKQSEIDCELVRDYIITNHPKLVYIQRSRGYSSRNALTIDKIKFAIDVIKSINNNIIVMVDNCYGEFIEKFEPTAVGADVIVGSLIKNAGGGIAPTGGYIAGKEQLIKAISYRLTSPSIGSEVGSYEYGYRLFYQGLFLAPHVTSQAVKGMMLFSVTMNDLGFKTLPTINDEIGDIVCSVIFDSSEQLISFCQGIQYTSPIDSYVTLEPW
ncbi:MAG: methionine gamma-lyase family protein, partial [Clostridia bacterium]